MARIPAKILRIKVPGATLADALPHLRETYCGTIAYEIEHIASHRQRTWLRAKIESGEFRAPLRSDEQRALLKRLIEVDALERFMHKAYLGQKQFSIEGLDMTVPMLDELIQLCAAHGAREVVLGMAHRGRLNVLAHNLGRPYDTIFAEFEGASTLEAVTTIPQGGTGDVKYHHGAQGSYQLPDGNSILVNLESNPSHLEYVGPVVTGATRAAQTMRIGPHARRDVATAVPIVLHGDAALPAQGVVPETLNLQALDGYSVGGTLHLLQNNQVGFTTDPDDARSTRWASDVAKGFDVPIIHVNADDVAACVAAVRLAFAFRREFGHDVLIDLIGYRRFGHNEADEPAYTQPEQAARIRGHKRVAEIWAEQLVAQGVVSAQDVEEETKAVWDELTRLHQQLKTHLKHADQVGREQPTGEYTLDRTPSPDVKTAVSAERLLILNDELLRIPQGFTVHPKLVKQLERRREAVGADGGIDWAHAESLAFASLLTEGTPIRLTGQDVERGTFSQRHMVLHDAKTGQTICPIQSLPGALAPFELHNSPLSEVACLGFEYGYSAEAPETLVLWEAQFGDFVNAAQVIVDQFIASGLAKWGQTSRLVLLLPHGYEGSGPEHSSGRLERFLTLASEGNMRVANVTTPAQYFHLIRRQARVAKQRPLILMTPKSLLRLPQATNRIEHLSETRFFPVLGRAARAGREGPPARAVHGQDLLRPRRPPAPPRGRGRRRRPRRAALSVPAGADPRADRAVPQPARGRLGTGGAAQHGRSRPHVPAPDADPSRAAALRLHRPARAREPGRGLSGCARRRAVAHRRDRARPLDSRLAVSGQDARRTLIRPLLVLLAFGALLAGVVSVGTAAERSGDTFANTIEGTPEKDRIRGGGSRDTLRGLGGNDLLSGGTAADQLYGGDGADSLDGGSGNDKLVGEEGNDFLYGFTGNDRLDGGPGNDRMDGFDGDDTLRGGEGNDFLGESRFGDDRLLDGGPGEDVLIGNAGADRQMLGGEGHDLLSGGTGNDGLDGGDGNDILLPGTGQANGRRAAGGDGDDVIVDSGSGDIDGGDGNDTLWMASDGLATRMYGGNGDDTFHVGASALVVDCGPGYDRVLLSGYADETIRVGGSRTTFTDCEQRTTGADLGRAPTLLKVLGRWNSVGVPIDSEVVLRAAAYEKLSNCNLARRRCLPGDRPQRILGTKRADLIKGGGGEDFLEGAAGSDALYGGDDDDSLFGRTGNDRLAGGNGHDELEGGRGDDVLRGGRGRDQLNGGFGRDRLLGGLGADTIRAVGGGADVIDCGPGTDRVEKDSRDRSRNCEIVL